MSLSKQRLSCDTETPVVLIAPLFDLDAAPSLGVSILKASLAQAGIDCKVLYPSDMLFEEIGGDLWIALAASGASTLMYECLFAPLAHKNHPPLTADLFNGNEIPGYLRNFHRAATQPGPEITQTMLDKAVAGCRRLMEWITARVAILKPGIIGFSNNSQGVNGTIALARAVKRILPETITVAGGSNCMGEMGHALAEGVPEIDYVFQGEADFAFADFCRDILITGTRPPAKVIVCAQPHDLDAIAVPDYSDYFADHDILPGRVLLSFESSRGCWWGYRHRCRFCAEPRVSDAYRFKSAARMLKELREQKRKHPEVEFFYAVDAIMPYQYYDTFLKELSAIDFGASFIYHTRAGVSAKEVALMRKAGITRIQPGIESLSSRVLKLLGKGTDAVQNISLLRHCREIGIRPVWPLLVGMPDDRAADYEEQARIMPFIRHLAPPVITPVFLMRGSPYFEDRERYGITDLRPLPAYSYAFPAPLDIERLAFFFQSQYPSESRERPEVLAGFRQQILLWQESWTKEAGIPELSLRHAGAKGWQLTDTRSGSGDVPHMIDHEEYELLRRCRQGIAVTSVSGNNRVSRLLDLGLLLAVDNVLLSVVCETDDGDGEFEKAFPIPSPI